MNENLKLNPLYAARIALGQTRADVAHRTSTSVQYVLRAEQGVFELPPTKLINHLELPITPTRIAYANYQSAVRSANAHLLSTKFLTQWATTHPSIFLRQLSGLTANQFCVLFCVQPALLHRFEKTPWLCIEPPGQILSALPVQFKHAMRQQYRAWRSNANETVQLLNRPVGEVEAEVSNAQI